MVMFQSVVSGEVESDLITVHRNWNNELTVLDRKIGSKKNKLELAGKGWLTGRCIQCTCTM